MSEKLEVSGPEPERILSERGRYVWNTAQHAAWREAYYKATQQGPAGELARLVAESRARRDLGPLNIYDTASAAQYLRVSRATAWLWMKTGVIPAFRLGGRWYVHGHILETVKTRGREEINKEEYIRLYPRLLLRADAREGGNT